MSDETQPYTVRYVWNVELDAYIPIMQWVESPAETMPECRLENVIL
jgi:hypothetical protein